MCPLCPVLLAERGLLIASMDAKVLFWRGLCCSTEAQDGGEVEDGEEEGRGRSGGEAGGPVGFSFSIIVPNSCPSSCTACVPSKFVSVCLYVCESK